MIKKIGILTTMVLIFGLVINFGYAQAYMIDIINPGFEDEVLGDGAWTENLPVNGWGIYSELGSGKEYYGVWNPTNTQTDGIPADYPDGVQGNNVGYLEADPDSPGEMGFEQTLSAKLEANTTYELKVDIGNTMSNYFAQDGVYYDYSGFPGYRIELLAGGDLLISDNNTLLPDEGDFLTSTVSYTAGSGDPIGESLTIRLLSLSADGDLDCYYEVDFDNVR